MKATGRTDESLSGIFLLCIALGMAIMTHGALLPFTHGNTYDAYIHMFFGEHYARSWFDPWEPRWYTGFATTSYPPGTHMLIGALSKLMPLRAAFVMVMLTGILLLTLGTYRFALVWVPPRAAGYAALALVLSSSVAEAVHLFGQLPTIFSLGVFLNGLPWVYRWIVAGHWRNFFAAIVFSAATTAAHHVTTLFGAVLFIIPLALQALRTVAELAREKRILADPGSKVRLLTALNPFFWPFIRGLFLAVAIVGGMVLTILPYWLWSVSDPITQVSIPHGSRESFFDRPDLGLLFFVIPWGASIIALPYAIYKGAISRLWPLAGSVILCFVLGTGGTTPIPKMLLRGAFDILTLDRFTYWATILILPFVGLMVDGLMHGRSGQMMVSVFGSVVRYGAVAALFGSYVLGAVFSAVLPMIRPMQPPFIDPAPIVAFLEQDNHDRWRYLTLGFGDQFAYLSAQTSAQSVDGNYHSARRLPDLTRYSVERLENAKYMGVPGLGSLQQFLINADRYHLKYIFSNDAFYDPLLTFTGWNQLNRLQNGIVIWEKPDVKPLPLLQARRDIPQHHRLMWGVLPPMALILAALVLVAAIFRRGFGRAHATERPIPRASFLPDDQFANPRRARQVVTILGALCVIAVGAGTIQGYRSLTRPAPAEEVLRAYFDDLDFRRFLDAYEKLDPETRGTFEEARFPWNWRGGLIASYGKLVSFSARPTAISADVIDWQVSLDWFSSLDVQKEQLALRTVRRAGQWYVVPTSLRPVQTPVRISRQDSIAWNVTGRRQPRFESDLHRDRLDRPQISLGPARLVRHAGRYSVVGSVFVNDADPAHITVTSQLLSPNDTPLAAASGGTIATHRLLPGEAGAFRIGFEGILSMDDADVAGSFDPKLFIPPILAETPDEAQVSARALVAAQNLYRGIALNGMTFHQTPEGGLEIRGTAVNTGTEIASITRLLASVFDDAAKPVWVEAAFVSSNIQPGQSSPFRFQLPPRDTITVISEVDAAKHEINGSGIAAFVSDPLSAGSATQAGAIALGGLGGYESVRLDVSSMTFDPEF
jgi:hypothetical protein